MIQNAQKLSKDESLHSYIRSNIITTVGSCHPNHCFRTGISKAPLLISIQLLMNGRQTISAILLMDQSNVITWNKTLDWSHRRLNTFTVVGKSGPGAKHVLCTWKLFCQDAHGNPTLLAFDLINGSSTLLLGLDVMNYTPIDKNTGLSLSKERLIHHFELFSSI